MRAKQFFYVCAGLFLLVAAYTLGAMKAEGQVPGNPVVAMTSWQGGSLTYVIAATANGSTYIYNPSEGPHFSPWLNIFGTIDASGKTWSGVKEGYRRR